MSDRGQRLQQARLYLVCDERSGALLDEVLDAGVDIVQLRMKNAAEEEIVRVGRRFAALCADHRALFILNDRPDLVSQVGADGAHIGQEDVPLAQAREMIGSDRLLGLSTHSPDQVRAARGVDYIGVGPVHATPTKPGRPAVGLDLVLYAAEHAAVPFFAIGGINAGNVDRVRAAGASRIAVVRAITEAQEPAAAVRSLLAAREDRVGTT